MKLFMHIGMGKTGTSSIQFALSQNTAQLTSQQARYLGMWFEAIDPKYANHLGFREFCQLPEEALIASARTFANHLTTLEKSEGVRTFLFSNEAMFGAGPHLKPFIAELANHIDLALIAYVRNPYNWLPSAFTQWGLFHKQQTGPLQPFRDRCHTLIGQYSALPFWIDTFGDRLTVRRHDTTMDVVTDFAGITGLALAAPDKRKLERPEPAEILLRAAFNNRFPQEVFPEKFSQSVLTRASTPNLADIAALCFQHDGIDEVIENRRDLFQTIHDKLGAEFDFLSQRYTAQAAPDMDALQRRLIDYLVEITFQQAERITRLESQIKTLIKDQ